MPKIKRQEFVGYAATLLQPYTQAVTAKHNLRTHKYL